jgi:hypothetical protein
MISKWTPAYREIGKYAKHLTEGRFISIDPSIGSTSSLPGFAVYEQARCINSGVLKIDISGTVPGRLRELAYQVRKLYRQHDPMVLIYEEIPSQRYGGGNAKAHASLLKALGVILSISGPDVHIGLHPISWKKMVRPEYVKGDEADAIEMGFIAIQIARLNLTAEKEKQEKKASKKA